MLWIVEYSPSLQVRGLMRGKWLSTLVHNPLAFITVPCVRGDVNPLESHRVIHRLSGQVPERMDAIRADTWS